MDPRRTGVAADGRDVLHNALGCLGLARTALARDNHALVLLVRKHVVVRTLGDRIHMRRHLEAVLAAVRRQHLIRVDAKIAEWIHRYEHITNVRVDLAIVEALMQVVIDGFVCDLR